jgi:hypothetical protein
LLLRINGDPGGPRNVCVLNLCVLYGIRFSGPRLLRYTQRYPSMIGAVQLKLRNIVLILAVETLLGARPPNSLATRTLTPPALDVELP